MRYVKVLLLVLIFFLSMVFFFQNQAVLSSEMVLHLNLFFVAPMSSISLPFYFLVLVAFLTGALAAMIALMWDKIQLSTKLMQANWRVRSLEKEVEKLNASLEPKAPKAGLFGKPKAAKKEEVAIANDAKKQDDYELTPPDPEKF